MRNRRRSSDSTSPGWTWSALLRFTAASRVEARQPTAKSCSQRRTGCVQKELDASVRHLRHLRLDELIKRELPMLRHWWGNRFVDLCAAVVADVLEDLH